MFPGRSETATTKFASSIAVAALRTTVSTSDTVSVCGARTGETVDERTGETADAMTGETVDARTCDMAKAENANERRPANRNTRDRRTSSASAARITPMN